MRYWLLHSKNYDGKSKNFPTSAWDRKHELKLINVQSYNLLNKYHCAPMTTILEFVLTTVKKSVLYLFFKRPEEIGNLRRSAHFQQGKQAWCGKIMTMAWMLWRRLWWGGDDDDDEEKGPDYARCRVSLWVHQSGALATEKHSGLCSRLGFFCLLVLLVPPNPIELGSSCAANKEVDGKEVPVFRDNDQWISGPDQTCGCQHSRLGGAEFICWSSHISQTSENQTPFKHWGPEENRFWTCRVVV